MDPHIQFISSLIVDLFFTVLQKKEFKPTFLSCSKAIDLLLQTQNHGNKLFVAHTLFSSFTKAELQNNLDYKRLPPKFDFAILQNNTLKPVYCLIKREEVLPYQKHESDSYIVYYGTDQFSIHITDKSNHLILLSDFKTVFQSNP